MCKTAREPPSWQQIEHAIRRNFGGFDEFDTIEVFKSKIHHFREVPEKVKCEEKWRSLLRQQHRDMEETKRRLYEQFIEEQHWNTRMHSEKECNDIFIKQYESGVLDEKLNKDFEQYFAIKFDGEV